MKALLSVSNKTGIEKFAAGLIEQGYELYSTGGTFKALEDADIAVKQVRDLTDFNEIMDGRVKTLHPAVHGGILADRDNAAHMEDLRKNNIETIDLVAVNLYPFKETVKKRM